MKMKTMSEALIAVKGLGWKRLRDSNNKIYSIDEALALKTSDVAGMQTDTKKTLGLKTDGDQHEYMVDGNAVVRVRDGMKPITIWTMES